MNKLITTIILGMVATAMAVAMEPGQYKGNFAEEKLLVFNTGEVVLTQSRQVGDSESFTGGAIVPDPTVCDYAEYGIATKEDSERLEYKLKSAQLIRAMDQKALENCSVWMAIHNAWIAAGKGVFSLAKADFKKVN